MQNNSRKVHYAWYILACCVLLNIVIHAPIMQVSNLYIVPMQEDFQVPRTLLSLQSVLMAAAAVITVPIWGRLYKKYDARILLSIATAVTALTTIGLAYVPNIWGVLILAAIKGISFTGNTALPNSILLTAWFQKRRGFAISTASLGISVGGVIFSPLIGALISSGGWRFSNQIVGLIMLVIMLPCTILIVRSTPKDKSLQPFGAQEAALQEGVQAGTKSKALYGMTAKEARRSPILWAFLLAVFSMTFATGAALQIPTYLIDIGWEQYSALAVSAYSAIGIAGKLLLGMIVDKVGEKKGSVYICVMGIVAFAAFIFAVNPAALVVMVVSYGLFSGITSVMPPLLTSKIFGNRDYGPIYGMVMSVNRFGGIIGNVLVSLLYDLTQSYAVIWPVCIAAMTLTLISILYCIKASRKLIATSEQNG